jgi:tRNA A37 threonylcarbamoyladenosine modification protein TsaB
VLDARRREVFVPGPRVCAPSKLDLREGELCVGGGAVRYRALLEARGALVPPDDDPRHVPWARHHASLAHALGPLEAVEPLYVRIPDAERSLP